jgi:hypothetical protein
MGLLKFLNAGKDQEFANALVALLKKSTKYRDSEGGFLAELKKSFPGAYSSLTPLGGGGATLHILGLSNTSTGTPTGRSPVFAGIVTSTRRVGFVGAAAINTQVGWRPNSQGHSLSNSKDKGGFLWVVRWANTGASNSGLRLFAGFGLSGGLISATVDPSTFQSIAAFATDEADANIQFMHNDGAGNATKINMGSDFPKNTQNLDLYEAAIYNFRNSYKVGYYIRNRATGAFRKGEVSTNIPPANTGLGWQVTLNSGPTNAVAPEIDLVEATEIFMP